MSPPDQFPPRISLGTRKVGLGWTRAVQGLESTLQPRELAALSRSATPKRKVELAAGRLAARAALEPWSAGTLDLAAETEGPYAGRPMVTGLPGLALSISHADGWAVAAVSPGSPLGVDLERLHRQLSDSFAQEAFAPGELEGISSLEVARESPRVVAWCLKEAFLKVWGVGLRAPLGLVGLMPHRELPWHDGFMVELGVVARPFNRPLPKPPDRMLAYVQVSEDGWVLSLAA